MFRDRQAHEIERLRQENERLREQLAEQAKRIADLGTVENRDLKRADER